MPGFNRDSEELLVARLNLSLACKKVLSDGLNTLTIQVPDAM